jgi:hypothetical protein
MPKPKQQYFSLAGIPLINGKIYTYAAGTSTPKQTFTDAAVAQPNPIPLNTRGEPTNAIFWDGSYRVEVRDALNNLIYTVDNYQTPIMPGDLSSVTAGLGAGLVGFAYGVAYPAGSIGKWLQNLALSAGSSFIGFIQAGVGAILRTLQSKARESVSIADYGAVTTDLTGVVNNAAIVAALAANDTVLVPPGLFYVTGSINAKNKAIIGVDGLSSTLQLVGANTNTSMFVNGGDITTPWGTGGSIVLRNLRLKGNWDGATANALVDISAIGGIVKWWGGAYFKIQNCIIDDFFGFGIFSYLLGYSEISSNHVYTGAKNGIHLEAASGAAAVTSTTLSGNSVHSIRGAGVTGGSCIYIKNGFSCDTFSNTLEDAVNGITIDGNDNRNLLLINNHIEQTSGYCVNYLGSGNNISLIGNIFATLPVFNFVNPAFSTYSAINNFQLQDTYQLPTVASPAAEVQLSAGTPKRTINSLVLTPGDWIVTAAWNGVNSAGAGQLSTRQEFALNTAAAIPAYSATFAAATMRGDCVSTVNTADGFLQGSLTLNIQVTANTTIYLYGGAASITGALIVSCAGWMKAKKVSGAY